MMTVDNTVFDITHVSEEVAGDSGVSEATNKTGCDGILGGLFRGCCCFDYLMFNWSMQCVSHDDMMTGIVM